MFRVCNKRGAVTIIDPIALFKSITSGEIYQITIGEAIYTKRITRSWVSCDTCGRDIRFGTKETAYLQKGKTGKRYCLNCFDNLVKNAISNGEPITIDFK